MYLEDARSASLNTNDGDNIMKVRRMEEDFESLDFGGEFSLIFSSNWVLANSNLTIHNKNARYTCNIR